MSLNKLKELTIPIVNYFGKKKENKIFTKPPTIIGGCGRSGTTLLLSILGAHPEIHSIPNEMKVFDTWREIDGRKIPRIDRIYRYIIMNNFPSEVKGWCEKTPRNVNHFGKIIQYFDRDVKLIHIVRDGRDVLLSRHPNDPNKFWVNPDRWIKNVKAGLDYLNNDCVLTIKYENLILSYEKTINVICDFLNIERVKELDDWVNFTNVKKSRAWFGSARNIHDNSIGKWKRDMNKDRIKDIMSNPDIVTLLKKLEYI